MVCIWLVLTHPSNRLSPFFSFHKLTAKSRGYRISQDGLCHKLTVLKCGDDDTAMYSFVAGEHSTKGKLTVGGTASLTIPAKYTKRLAM